MGVGKMDGRSGCFPFLSKEKDSRCGPIAEKGNTVSNYFVLTRHMCENKKYDWHSFLVHTIENENGNSFSLRDISRHPTQIDKTNRIQGMAEHKNI
jgi:hypothetical protein